MAEHLYDIRDPRFLDCVVTSAGLEEIADNCRWTEGPVWFAEHNLLLFSDIPTSASCAGSRGRGSVPSASPRISPMVIRGIGRVGWYPANMARAA